MKDLSGLIHEHSKIYRILLILFVLGLILWVTPREINWEYSYSKGKPWRHNSLYAEFDYAILKSTEELEKDKKQVLETSPMFFYSDTSEQALLRNHLISNIVNSYEWSNTSAQEAFKGALEEILNAGIGKIPDSLKIYIDRPVKLVKGKSERITDPESWYSMQSAYDSLAKRIRLNDKRAELDARRQLAGVLRETVLYDEVLTHAVLREGLHSIPEALGKVNEGELIVGKGELITDHTFQKIYSYERKLKERSQGTPSSLLLLLGQVIFTLAAIVIIILALRYFSPEDYAQLNSFTLILGLFILSHVLGKISATVESLSIYALPLVVFAILFQTFFKPFISSFIYVIFILSVAQWAPNPLEFIWIELPVGILVIIWLTEMVRRSQLIAIIMVTFISTSILFLASELMSVGNLVEVHWSDFVWFGISAILTFLAIPLIYIVERLFGLVSSISLLELSDTNNRVLRELGEVAPGTFQHSLQVANLSESCARLIGGNTLLIRTGALYHDIGKMANPKFFIENQIGSNPHDDMSPAESASMIIKHVVGGVELARRNGLPEAIIDFIRTHHGTTTTRYFLSKARMENPEISSQDFKYPGPKPFSKETAILMICDGVEAASRSLSDYSKPRLNRLVDDIIKYLLESGQLSNAPITLNDINKIKNLLKQKLSGIYHGRIEYPD